MEDKCVKNWSSSKRDRQTPKFSGVLGIKFGDRQLCFGENGLLCITEDVAKSF